MFDDNTNGCVNINPLSKKKRKRDTDDTPQTSLEGTQKVALFEDEEDNHKIDEFNFEHKEYLEGKKGQQVIIYFVFVSGRT